MLVIRALFQVAPPTARLMRHQHLLAVIRQVLMRYLGWPYNLR